MTVSDLTQGPDYSFTVAGIDTGGRVGEESAPSQLITFDSMFWCDSIKYMCDYLLGFVAYDGTLSQNNNGKACVLRMRLPGAILTCLRIVNMFFGTISLHMQGSKECACNHRNFVPCFLH